MTGRRSTIFVCGLCALLLSAFAAAGAGAATNGTTEFTCVKEAGGGAGSFKDSHCKESSASGEYRHVAITKNTEANFNNKDEAGVTPFLMSFTFGEFPLTITAARVEGEAALENKLTESGEHSAEFESPAEGTGLELWGITTSSPYCKVVGLPGGEGVIKTKPLLVRTREQGMQVRFEPRVGTLIAEFEVVGIIEPNKCLWKGTYKIIGTFTGTPAGTTINFTHATGTSEKTLRIGSPSGVVVGVEGTLMTSARASAEQPYTPIGPTTVETP